MFRGTTALSKAYRGTTPIKQIYRGTQLIWELWTLITALYYTLTSNSAPSPFTASMLTGVTSGSAYQVGDNSSTTKVVANYFAANTLGLGVRILFGTTIRISKVKVRGNRSGQTNATFTVRGVKVDDSTVVIYQGVLSVNSDNTVDVTDKVTEFKGVDFYIDTRSDLICELMTGQVVEYWQKG